MIGIIEAMKVEVEGLKKELKDLEVTTISGIEFNQGFLNGTPVVIAVCGIGKVFAAICAQTMILKFGVDKIINTGVAGSLSPDLEVGDMVVATAVCQHDMDTSGLGDPVGMVSGLNQIFFETDKALQELALESARDKDFKCVTGVIATGDQFMKDTVKGELIAATFKAVAVEMEGGAIGQVCAVNKIPFLVIRVMSDCADDGANVDYAVFLDGAAKESMEVVKGIAESYAS